MSNNWLSQNAGGSGAPAVAFESIGAAVVVSITSEPRVVTTKNDRNEDVESLVVEGTAAKGTAIRAGKADDRNDVTVGDEITLWIKAGAMARAVMEACRKAGSDGLSEGGTLAVQYVGDGERKPGKHAPKLYAAEYVAPKPTVGIGRSLLGDNDSF